MDIAFRPQGDAAKGLYDHLGWKGLQWITVIGGMDLLLPACFENLSHSKAILTVALDVAVTTAPSPVPLLAVIARKPGRTGKAGGPATLSRLLRFSTSATFVRRSPQP